MKWNMSESGALPVTPDPVELRYAGEDVVDRVDLSGSRVVVTTHRVLIATPDGPGSRFRSVHRPNVLGIERNVRTDGSAGRQALQAGLYAIIFLAAGLFLDLDGLAASINLSGTEVLGGLATSIGRLLSLLALLDDLLVGAGLFAGVIAVGFAGLYVRQREREFRIEVADGDHVSLPPQDREEAVAARLRDAVRGEGE
jgi:hypothetical protein